MEEAKNNHKEHKEHKEHREHKEKEAEEKTLFIKESEYLQLQAEAQKAKEYWEKVLRLQADFENARKRWERDRQDVLRFGNEDLISELLNIIDELERSLELTQGKHEDFTAFLKGVEMILAHLHDLLKKYDVVAIDSKGKIFDPNFHEALMQAEDENMPENTVIEEMQKGYLLNNKVIRTAKVKVSKKKN